MDALDLVNALIYLTGLVVWFCGAMVVALLAGAVILQLNEGRPVPDENDSAVIAERLLEKWARDEDARRARSVAKIKLLSRLTNDDKAYIEAMIIESGCRVEEDAT